MSVLKIKKLVPEAKLPVYAHGPENDSGMDLYSVAEAVVPSGTIRPVKTGISIQLRAGYEAQVRSRSGLALKQSVVVAHGVGTIDPSYRGEIIVLLHNFSDKAFHIKPGDRIAQLVISRYEVAEWLEVDELEETVRGAGGFGSTGS